MGGISDEHVEWAIVNRLKAMLDESPKTTFNVSQSFAPLLEQCRTASTSVWVDKLPGRGGSPSAAVMEALKGNE